MAVTSRPSPVVKKAALAVRDASIAEERGERRDRGRPGRGHLLERECLLGRRVGLGHDRDLAVGGVAAGWTQDQDILPGRVEDHEFVGLRSAHDPDIRGDGHGLETQSFEGANVGVVLGLVTDVEAGPVPVAAVGILHDELANSDEPAASAGLVAPLRLEVVDHHRELAIGLDDIREQDPDDLFVGHREDHVPTIPILEPGQLRADGVVAAAGAPDIGRVDDRHLHLLRPDPVLLLADDLLDPVVDALAQRQERVDARPQLADVAGAQQQPVRGHLGIGRVVAERGEEQVGESHGPQG